MSMLDMERPSRNTIIMTIIISSGMETPVAMTWRQKPLFITQCPQPEVAVYNLVSPARSRCL